MIIKTISISEKKLIKVAIFLKKTFSDSSDSNDFFVIRYDKKMITVIKLSYFLYY